MKIEQDLVLPDGRRFTITDEWSGTRAGAQFYYTDGNAACDCNASSAIRAQIDPSFPELPCGSTIQIDALRGDGENIPLDVFIDEAQ